MKSTIGALALLLAAPAFAQAAPAADPHAGHSPKEHAQHQQQGHAGHEQHDKDCCKDGTHACCDKKAADGKAMECCAKAKAAKADAHSGHHAH